MKRIIQYIKYFFFIAFKWNPLLAFFTLKHEIRGEKKYGLDTSGIDTLKDFTVTGNKVNAEIYQGANYYLLEEVFTFLRTENVNTKMIDFGCGKGRVLAVAAYFGFTDITGIEFAKPLSDAAEINLKNIRRKFPDTHFNIVYEDASVFDIPVTTKVFFFFNPFNEKVMLQVVKNMLSSVRKYEREIFVVYINPVHEELFLSAGFQCVFEVEKMTYISAKIFMLPISEE
ncbi:hypothetical protein BH09BAC2_BH09BAC2_16390 [soil metagenome]